jgi:CRP/FNR family transcriptional regulator, cyclic AMP receptor protein
MDKKVATKETFQDGQVLFEEGSSDECIYVVESGSVELSKDVKGKKLILEIVNPGGIFGEMAFILHGPRRATARAVGKTTVGIIDRNFIEEEYNKTSQSFRILLKTLALRLKKTTDAVVNIEIGKDRS